MKRQDITAMRGAGLLLGALFLLVGFSACQDQLLPPDPKVGETAREVLVYYNDFGLSGPIGYGDSADLGVVAIRAKRPDGSGARTIVEHGIITSSARAGTIAYYFEDPSLNVPSGIYLAKDDGDSSRLFEQAYVGGNLGFFPPSIVLGPDGRTVVWIAVDDDMMARLTVRTPTMRRVYELGVTYDDPNAQIVPVFSPDGRYVAFMTMNGDMIDRSTTITLIRTTDGSVRELPIPMYTLGVIDPYPQFDWSPDSRRILFFGAAASDTMGLYSEPMLLDVESGSIQELPSDGLFKMSPRWLPSGSQFCFIGYGENSGAAELYLRDVSGRPVQLTNDASTYKYGLSVSADGRSAVFTEMPLWDQALGSIRSYDFARMAPGPILGTYTDLGHWRR